MSLTQRPPVDHTETMALGYRMGWRPLMRARSKHLDLQHLATSASSYLTWGLRLRTTVWAVEDEIIIIQLRTPVGASEWLV